MKLIPFILLVLCGLLVGCQPKTPEEVEAAKYPQVKVNTASEDKALSDHEHQLMQSHSGKPGSQ